MLLHFQMLQVHTLYYLHLKRSGKEVSNEQKKTVHCHYCNNIVKNVPNFIATNDDNIVNVNDL